ncbi:MAG: cytochrome c oxidase assembly protein [Anaerolineales bacterium]|jgi:putative membrane protein
MNELLQIGWTWYPSVVIGFSLWTVFYVLANRSKQTPWWQQAAFHLGTLAGLLALFSPLDELGDEYLFSAHMVQHLLLMFVTAPLWLLGTPGWLVDGIIPERLDKLVKRLASPLSAFVAFVGVLWFWHVPAIYELAQESEAIHIFEHLSFIGAALIGWCPVAGAETSRLPKPAPPVRMLYLFLLTVPCTALAAILTFAGTPMYPFYVTAPHIFGLDALQDQHLGGLLMWLPTHMFLLLAIGITFLRWFIDSGRKSRQNFEPAEHGTLLKNDLEKLGV